MRNHEILVWATVGALGLAFVLMILVRRWGDRRLRKRLRKTHGRIISKARQPAVKLSVNPPKE